jgi:hypothetical protein
MNNDKPRRLIVPLQKSSDGATVRVDRVSSISNSIDRAFGIVDEQLMKIGIKSRTSGMLDEKDVKALHGHIKALVELSKEERERDKSNKDPEDLKDLTHEQLLELAATELGTAKDITKK